MFRGVRYEISVKREGPGNVVSLEVDGMPVLGTVIPLPAKNVRNLKVTATIGRERK
jgi:cellobiose phosphorylase